MKRFEYRGKASSMSLSKHRKVGKIARNPTVSRQRERDLATLKGKFKHVIKYVASIRELFKAKKG